MDLFRSFDRAFLINLPERTDRLRDMQAQLRRIGVSTADGVEYFKGIVPVRQDNWPSIGARGNFLSHYNVLRQARDRGLQSVAVLEDDCDFPPYFATVQERFAEQLATVDWGIVFFGHVEHIPVRAGPYLWPMDDRSITQHFYAVHSRVLGRMVAYLEEVIARPSGHPLGGPQYIDGAFSMFREQNPDVVTLLAIPSLGWQRSSRSDLHPRWFDRPRSPRGLVNWLRGYRRRRPR